MIKALNKFEKSLWVIGVVVISCCFFGFGNNQYHYLIASLIGITALIFVSTGHPLGQLLTIVFSVFYGVISYSFAYYGEMITYLGMSAPMAVVALIQWLRHPFNGNKAQVTVNRISKKETILFLLVGLIITINFYFVLKLLNTSNLIISTISVYTSFIASYLTARRSRFYAVGYALNDIVLIIMWSYATLTSISYFPMIICFCIFFISDTYGFINWTRISHKQKHIQDDINSK